jgi:hypothetical protein
MSDDKLLKNAAATLLNDTQATAFSMAAECTGLKHSALIRQYIVRGLIQDKFLEHPMARYQQQAKAG